MPNDDPEQPLDETRVGPGDAAPETGPEPEEQPEPKAPPSAEELAALRKAADERDDLYERLLRAHADHENYRKRMTKQMEDRSVEGLRRLAADILTVADHMDLALDNAEGAADPEKVLTGVRMVRDELHKVLAGHGVQPIQAEGQPFDPAYHEAVMQDVTDQTPPGTVTGEVRKGYVFRERLLRAARVKVAAAPLKADDSA